MADIQASKRRHANRSRFDLHHYRIVERGKSSPIRVKRARIGGEERAPLWRCPSLFAVILTPKDSALARPSQDNPKSRQRPTLVCCRCSTRHPMTWSFLETDTPFLLPLSTEQFPFVNAFSTAMGREARRERVQAAFCLVSVVLLLLLLLYPL